MFKNLPNSSIALLDGIEIDLDQENNRFETITFNVVIVANGFTQPRSSPAYHYPIRRLFLVYDYSIKLHSGQ